MFIEEKCDFCGDCLVLCPYVEYDRDEAIEQFRLVVAGEEPEILSRCVTCVACNQFCEKGANPFDLMVRRQEQTGVLNIPDQNVQVFENLPNAPSEIVEGDPGRPAISLCVVGDMIPGLFDGPLFEGLTVLKGGDYFCYLGWVHLGFETPIREGARTTVDNIAKAGVEELVCYHDDCYSFFTVMVKDYGIEVPFRPVHIIEYLLDYVRENEGALSPLSLNVAYQQPCASRYTPWKDEQLDELFERIGVTRLDREYDRINALCCGSPMVPRDREEANAIKMRNIEDAAGHGALAMAYLCPLCYLGLRKRATAAGLENHHIIELVKQSIGS